MDFKTKHDHPDYLESLSESGVFFCALLFLILIGLPGCAHKEKEYADSCPTISNRVKKSFLFHKDKCSPHPYRSLEGYQTDLDRYVVTKAAKKCAKQSLKTIACNCKEKPSKAFRKGYEQAYIDVAMGDSGEVPPVPPEEYWAAHYRTPQGYLEVQEWFTGYKLGAEHALADGRYDYNEIATPYSLSGWSSEADGYWGVNATHSQVHTPVEPAPQIAPPAPSAINQPVPGSDTEQVKPTAPEHPLTLPAPPAPESSLPALPPKTRVVPQKKQPQVKPVLPKPPSHSAPPVTAPKPPIPMPKAIHAPEPKLQQPKVKQPSQPVYINDDPPPSPYTLQGYPFKPSHTPLPGRRTEPAQIQQLQHNNEQQQLQTPESLPDYFSR